MKQRLAFYLALLGLGNSVECVPVKSALSLSWNEVIELPGPPSALKTTRRFTTKNLLGACAVFFIPRLIVLLAQSTNCSELCSNIQHWVETFEYWNITDIAGLACMMCWLYRDKLLSFSSAPPQQEP